MRSPQRSQAQVAECARSARESPELSSPCCRGRLLRKPIVSRLRSCGDQQKMQIFGVQILSVGEQYANLLVSLECHEQLTSGYKVWLLTESNDRKVEFTGRSGYPGAVVNCYDAVSVLSSGV
ncbi:uncharacterized protein LOC129774851 [Toxorhynchites rutilus septentrionalis]|uniref:uncharacterized protein LOC129774851 n=1 Tax=Toxorhynchites rutilus septentrionalis TaxID=329112 RepID=UPI0024791E9B|nr:uncharacterized protein LOC129774851 [Toxorhynchites rutilus septentrionalis]